MTVFWFRRDLRIADNHGLWLAARSGQPLLPIFIFDKNILGPLPREDARVAFIHAAVTHLQSAMGGNLQVHSGRPLEIFDRLVKKHKILNVVANEDYEPYARNRDAEISEYLKNKGIDFSLCRDHVVFSPDELATKAGTPFRVYSAFARQWRARLDSCRLAPFASGRTIRTALGVSRGTERVPPLRSLGFSSSQLEFSPPVVPRAILKSYTRNRDRLDVEGTSRLGVHLRFGTLSVRHLIRVAKELSPTYLDELIWREFFIYLLYWFPTLETEPFDSRFHRMKWRNDRTEFKRWCDGQTGVPIVDAAQRELNATGFLSNRARMISASFLTKHLLIDWRWGERYFAAKLLDYELASNVGNWQWVAGCGVDRAPFFRIFNPDLQALRYDPRGAYVSHWIGKGGRARYPSPIVDLEYGRRRALAAWRQMTSEYRD